MNTARSDRCVAVFRVASDQGGACRSELTFSRLRMNTRHYTETLQERLRNSSYRPSPLLLGCEAQSPFFRETKSKRRARAAPLQTSTTQAINMHLTQDTSVCAANIPCVRKNTFTFTPHSKSCGEKTNVFGVQFSTFFGEHRLANLLFASRRVRCFSTPGLSGRSVWRHPHQWRRG